MWVVSSEAAISARASGTPITLVAGFAKGGARLVGRADLKISSVKDLKGKSRRHAWWYSGYFAGCRTGTKWSDFLISPAKMCKLFTSVSRI
jgi:hypothetical protein